MWRLCHHSLSADELIIIISSRLLSQRAALLTFRVTLLSAAIIVASTRSCWDYAQ